MNTRLSGDTRDNPIQRADTTRVQLNHAVREIDKMNAELARLRADRDEWKLKYEAEWQRNPMNAGTHDVKKYYEPEEDAKP